MYNTNNITDHCKHTKYTKSIIHTGHKILSCPTKKEKKNLLCFMYIHIYKISLFSIMFGLVDKILLEVKSPGN